MQQVIQTFDTVLNIRYKFNPSDGNQIIKIFENNGQNIIRQMGLVSNHVTVSSFIKDLTCYTEITSIPEVGFLDFKLEDSETDKGVKAIEHTWTKPAMHLKMWDNSHNREWQPLCIVPLQNPEIYAYRKYDLLDELTRNLAAEGGDGWALGVSIEDAGWGGVKTGDIVIIRGTVTQQIVVNNPTEEITKDILLNTMGSVNDQNIGQRAIDDSRFVGNAATGDLTTLLSSLAHQIKNITGLSSWKQLPTTTLEKLKHLENLTTQNVTEIQNINVLQMLYQSIEDDLALLEANVLKLSDLNLTFNTAWTPIAFKPNWSNQPAFDTAIPSWRLLRNGNVELRGAIKATVQPAYNEIIATLPIAARPENNVYILFFGTELGQVAVDVLGNLRYQVGNAISGILIDKSYSVD